MHLADVCAGFRRSGLRCRPGKRSVVEDLSAARWRPYSEVRSAVLGVAALGDPLRARAAGRTDVDLRRRDRNTGRNSHRRRSADSFAAEIAVGVSACAISRIGAAACDVDLAGIGEGLDRGFVHVGVGGDELYRWRSWLLLARQAVRRSGAGLLRREVPVAPRFPTTA